MSMETSLVIESMDFVSHELFIAYFSDGTYVEITAEELRKRFADLIMQAPKPDDD
jgi:hypothetical protein